MRGLILTLFVSAAGLATISFEASAAVGAPYGGDRGAHAVSNGIIAEDVAYRRGAVGGAAVTRRGGVYAGRAVVAGRGGAVYARRGVYVGGTGYGSTGGVYSSGTVYGGTGGYAGRAGVYRGRAVVAGRAGGVAGGRAYARRGMMRR
jgi:hypothetical protein